MECFTADISQFFNQKMSKFGSWVDGWVFAFKSNYFRGFLESS